MSGHSKWHNIKRKKSVQDNKKAKVFSKLSKLIIVEAREGGGNPDMNPSLRTLIEKAKSADMPKENIERAIKRGTGSLEGVSYETIVYEGYGPGGVAFLIKAVTDNKNRTVSDLRFLFDSYGGSLGESGSAAYIFEPDVKNPSFTIEISDFLEEKRLKDLVCELEDHSDVQSVYTNMKKDMSA